MFQIYPIRLQPSLRRTLDPKEIEDDSIIPEPIPQNRGMNIVKPVKSSDNARVEPSRGDPSEPPESDAPRLINVAERTVLDHIIDNLE